MASQRSLVAGVVLSALAILALGSDKAPSPEGELLLSKLGVLTVPGGTETLTVRFPDASDLPRSFTVECVPAGIAAVTKTDSMIVVTGLAYGRARLAIAFSSGPMKFLPVEVYNPRMMETEDLLIAFTDKFTPIWSTKGQNQDQNWQTASYYRPVTADGFHALGSLGFGGYDDPSGKKWIVVLKAKAGSDALKPPVGYEHVWDNRDWHGDPKCPFRGPVSFWNPIPPEGYRALGSVVTSGYGKPALNEVACVREDLTAPGVLDCNFYNGHATLPGWFGVFPVVPAGDLTEFCHLSIGTFSASAGGAAPASHHVAYVLKVRLPTPIDVPYQNYVPRLTSYDEPPEWTIPTMTREMVIPWTMIKDVQFGDAWRVNNTPFYRLERQVLYRRLYHDNNQTDATQTWSDMSRVGVTTTESETYKREDGLGLSILDGITLGIPGAGGEVKITTSISKSLGFESQTSIAELREDRVTISLATPPQKAGAIWQRYNRLVLKRHKGTRLEIVKVWEFGSNSYVKDQYPD